VLLYAAAVKVTENAPDKTRFAAMAKRLATDTGSSVVDRALSYTAATAISRTIRSSASGAICGSIRSWKAPTRSCAT
jgi:hypothetical protein